MAKDAGPRAERPKEDRKAEGKNGGERAKSKPRTRNSTSSTAWNSSNGRSLKSDQLRSITFPFSVDIFCPVARPSDQSPVFWEKSAAIDHTYGRPCHRCLVRAHIEIAGPFDSVISAQRAAVSIIIVGLREPSTRRMSARELRFHPDYVTLWTGLGSPYVTYSISLSACRGDITFTVAIEILIDKTGFLI